MSQKNYRGSRNYRGGERYVSKATRVRNGGYTYRGQWSQISPTGAKVRKGRMGVNDALFYLILIILGLIIQYWYIALIIVIIIFIGKSMHHTAINEENEKRLEENRKQILFEKEQTKDFVYSIKTNLDWATKNIGMIKEKYRYEQKYKWMESNFDYIKDYFNRVEEYQSQAEYVSTSSYYGIDEIKNVILKSEELKKDIEYMIARADFKSITISASNAKKLSWYAKYEELPEERVKRIRKTFKEEYYKFIDEVSKKSRHDFYDLSDKALNNYYMYFVTYEEDIIAIKNEIELLTTNKQKLLCKQ